METNPMVKKTSLAMDHKIKAWNLEKVIQMELKIVKTQIIK
jgi:hypothetical protein